MKKWEVLWLGNGCYLENYSGRSSSLLTTRWKASVIHSLYKPLLSVKVEIDSIDRSFGIRQLSRRDVSYVPGWMFSIRVTSHSSRAQEDSFHQSPLFRQGPAWARTLWR